MTNQIVPSPLPSPLPSPPQLSMQSMHAPAIGPAPHRPPESPLLLLHRHLRGRYIPAVVLGVLLAIPAAVIGWKAVPPTYESTGLVRIAPTLPKLIYQNEENQLLPMFDSFVATQAAFIKSRRVVDLAANRQELRDAGWPGPPDGTAALDRALEATTRRGSELIIVSVKHRDPKLAQAATNAVLKTYEEIQDELNGTSTQKRHAALEVIAANLASDLAGVRTNIKTLSEQQGTDDLEELHRARVDAMVRLKSMLDELDLAIARAGESDAPGEDPEDLRDAETLAKSDTVLRGLLDEQESLKLQEATLAPTYKESHPTMIDLRRRQAAVEARINARVAMAKSPEAADRPGELVETLTRERARIAALHEAAVAELRKLGSLRMSIRTQRARELELIEEQKLTIDRMDQLRIERESTQSGRISIAQTGDLPARPATDRRRPLAAFGAAAGFGAGVGAVWAFGFLRRGYRYVDELSDRHLATSVLGILPELGEQDADADEQAALSVHHIRNTLQLQMRAEPGRGRAIAVTSPMSGDGKTHLSLALGLSFAVTGERTLIIDADLVGRSLSSELNLADAKGFSEALRAETLNGEVHAVRPNLWVIPAGGGGGLRPQELSAALVQPFLERARAAFDTVIIDTGPIMGSLEAAVATALTDRVVLVVTRGQSPGLVRSAVERVRSAGGACAGIVFNRAQPRDFLKSGSMMSASDRRSRAATSTARPTGTNELARILTSVDAGNQTHAE